MSFVKVLAFLAVYLALVAVINCADFNPCATEAKYGKLNSIKVSNCNSTVDRCPFKTGQNVSMELTFETNKDLDSAKIKIAGILSIVPVPFRINPDTVCSYGASCPLKKGVQNTINLEFPIKPSYPTIRLLVQVQLSGPEGESVVCVRFPASIIN